MNVKSRQYTEVMQFIYLSSEEFFEQLDQEEVVRKINNFLSVPLVGRSNNDPKFSIKQFHVYVELDNKDQLIVGVHRDFVTRLYFVFDKGQEILAAITQKYGSKSCPSVLTLFPVLRLFVKTLNNNLEYSKELLKLRLNNQEKSNWYSWNIIVPKRYIDAYKNQLICTTFLGFTMEETSQQHMKYSNLSVRTLGQDGLIKETPLKCSIKKHKDKCRTKKMRRMLKG